MEYGDYHDRMVAAVDNGRINCNSSCKLASMEEVPLDNSICLIKEDPLLSEQNFDHESGWLRQFNILIMRMWLQMWRDKVISFTFTISLKQLALV